MELPKKFLHDRTILLLVTVIAGLLVIGISGVMLRFDVSKNPTTIVAYRPNAGNSVLAGKPFDIYLLAIYMLLSSVGAVLLAARIFLVRRIITVFILASTVFLLALAVLVSNSLISIQ